MAPEDVEDGRTPVRGPRWAAGTHMGNTMSTHMGNTFDRIETERGSCKNDYTLRRKPLKA